VIKDRESIVGEFEKYINKRGGAATSWYAGVAADPEDRLFNGHSVLRDSDAWIYDKAYSAEAAASIERYFIEVVGTDGGGGGWTETSNWAYLYRKTPYTTQ